MLLYTQVCLCITYLLPLTIRLTFEYPLLFKYQ